jgi:hypothetical protein
MNATTLKPCTFSTFSTRASLAACMLMTGLLTTLSGCASDPRSGYSAESTFPAGIKTVSVDVFDNYSTTPGVETALTEAVIKEIQRSSGMRVVTKGRADSTLRGVVTNVALRRISLEPTTGMVQELAVTVTIDFDWKDVRTGNTLASRRGFAAADTFVPPRPTGEPRSTRLDGATQRLAQDLVNELRSAW